VAKLDVPVVAIRVERNTAIEMRDGTVLRADIFRTDSADSHPVLLIRNPYGEPMVRMAPVLPAIEAGFAVVVQHCRGTGTSDCFDRNPGNGAPAATATEANFVVAEQTIRHDAEHPSYITLPVIPRSGPGLAGEAR
jgi:predicted acyl esterase